MNQKLTQLHNQISQIHNYSQRFQHPSLIINRKSREKISKDISLVKKNTINQLDLIDVYTALH